MRDRLTRITTKGGDSGQSGLADGTRHSKTAPHFDALGDVDELNCAIGAVVSAMADDHPLRATLIDIQSTLFDLGGAIALPRTALNLDAEVHTLDGLIAQHTARLGPLTNFILPGGNPCAAQAHLARAVCRRAERSLWTLHETCPDDYPASLGVYMNRLSDALFVFARVLNEGTPELLWQQRKR
jgi:cob(I)alamin adenosyltransferase